MKDEQYYLQATNEVESGQPNQTLWAKALALVEGDSAKARYQYIWLRVEQLSKGDDLVDLNDPPDGSSTQVDKVTAAVPEESSIGSIPQQESDEDKNNEIGFAWWTTWGWLGLILGNLYLFSIYQESPDLAIIFIAVNSILMVMVLFFNKYAFLIATILSMNPILWVINGFYLKNRWRHPMVNGRQKRDEM